MLKQKNWWKIYYVLLLLVTALYFDRGFCATGDYPVLARDTDGYNVVDLNGARAETSGRLNVDTLRVGSLTVTNSASLPTSGTVPIHPIFGYHDTNATGAQLNVLVGGASSEAASLHNHSSASGDFTAAGNLTASGNLAVSGGNVTLGSSSNIGVLGYTGIQHDGEFLWWKCDDNAASIDMLDFTGHLKGNVYVNNAAAYSNQITTTTAVLGGRAFYLSGYAGNKAQVILPSIALNIGNTDHDFTVSFWHKPAKAALATVEYPMHFGSNFYISMNTAGRYYCAMAPAGGTAFYVYSAAGYYGTGFHLITFGRSGTTFFFYVDGALVGSNTAEGNVGSVPVGLRFGGVYNSTGMGRGVFDDVRVYRYGLSPAQVVALYNAGAGTRDGTLGVTSVGGALNLPSRSGYVAEVRNLGNSTAYKGIKVQAGENTASANNEMLGCYEGDGDQRGALVIDSSRNVAIWNVSDARVKTGIKETTRDALGILSKVRVYDYKLKDAGTPGFGFLAQEITSAAPESGGILDIQEMRDTSSTLGVLKTDNGTTITLTDGQHFQKSDPGIKIEGTHVVRYAKVPVRVQRPGVIQTALIPYLWKIAQLQQAQITALKARVTTLETKVKLQ